LFCSEALAVSVLQQLNPLAPHKLRALINRYINWALEAPGAGPLNAMRSVYSYPFPVVIELIRNLFLHYPYELFWGWIRPPGLDNAHVPIIERFMKFQEDALPGLSGFRFRYPTAGANEGIREAFTKLKRDGKTQIYILQGEYEGYEEVALAHGIRVIKVDPNQDPAELPAGWWFISNPSARDGNIIPNEFIRKICDAGHHVYYDLAYLGLTDFHAFDLTHPNIDGVFVSLSKSFGIFGIRAGFMFSRERVDGLTGNVWFRSDPALQVADAILHGIRDPQHLTRLYRPFQTAVVADLNRLHGLNLRPSDVVLLAYQKVSDVVGDRQAKVLSRFDRAGVGRLTLTRYFLEMESWKSLVRIAIFLGLISPRWRIILPRAA